MKSVISDTYVQRHGDFLVSLPGFLGEGGGSVVYAQRNEVRRVEHQGQVFIVKRYKRPHLVQRMAYTWLRPSKAERAYRYAAVYRQRGIDTPREVAYLERRRHGLFCDSWFVSLEAPGTEGHLLLREVEHFDTGLACAVVARIADMHHAGILHGDLNLSNFLCMPRGDGWQLTVIDINRSRFVDGGWPSDKQCLENLVRLTHRRDLYAFLVARYAELRGWAVKATVDKALQMLEAFENRRFKL